MTSIIKKGTNASAFKLSSRTIVCDPNIITVITDDEYAELMNKYGNFIKERVLSDKNPGGCFILNNNKDKKYAEDMNKEVGEVKDNSSRINLDKKKSV